MRAIRREIIGDDRESGAAATGRPGGELLQSGATGTQQAVRPLQVGRADMTRIIREEGYLVSHDDGDLGLERARISPAGTPGHAVTAPQHRLLLLGNELILPPESRQRPSG